MTCKLGLAVGLGFFQISVDSVILCVRLSATDAYSIIENCITKPCHVAQLPF